MLFSHSPRRVCSVLLYILFTWPELKIIFYYIILIYLYSDIIGHVALLIWSQLKKRKYDMGSGTFHVVMLYMSFFPAPNLTYISDTRFSHHVIILGGRLKIMTHPTSIMCWRPSCCFHIISSCKSGPNWLGYKPYMAGTRWCWRNCCFVSSMTLSSKNINPNTWLPIMPAQSLVFTRYWVLVSFILRGLTLDQ